MRAMDDEEFYHFRQHVKCPWLDCAGGLGLAGHGACSFGGDWDNPDCPEYITDFMDKNRYKDNNKEYWEERDRDNYLDVLEVFSEVET